MAAIVDAGIAAHRVPAIRRAVDRADAGETAPLQGEIGSAVADLLAGPYGSFGGTGNAAKPPFGIGSLGIQVSDSATTQSPPSEKVAFGNEVDFFGQPVSGLNRAGFHVLPDSGERRHQPAQHAQHRVGDQSPRG